LNTQQGGQQQGEVIKLPIYYEGHEQALRSSLHAIHTFYSLLIMMLFMTYNGYLNISLIFGAFASFLLFQRKQGEAKTKATSCH
jgi:copper transporter 1